MLTKKETIALTRDLIDQVGGITTCDLPAMERKGVLRPPLVVPEDSPEILKKAVHLGCEGKSLVDLHEVFAMLVDMYMLSDSTPTRHIFVELREQLGLSSYSSPIFLPKCVGLKSMSRSSDFAHAFGIALWAGVCNGGNLSYGQDSAIVEGDGVRFGLEDGHVVCAYDACCVPFESRNWTAFFTEPRRGETYIPAEYKLLAHATRSMSKTTQNLAQAAAWAAQQAPKAIVRSAFYGLKYSDPERHLVNKILNDQDIRGPLQEVLVPHTVTQQRFNSILGSNGYRQLTMFPVFSMDDSEVEAVVRYVLSAINPNITMKRKTHANSAAR